MSRGTLVPASLRLASCTRLLRSLGSAFQPLIPLASLSHIAGPQPRTTCVMRFGLIRVRSPLLTDSRLISLPEATEMFQFTSFPAIHYVFMYDWSGIYPDRVSPFGHLRVAGYLLLTAAFRSLSRPSSAPGAKASALRSL